jgi:hypothetical protein
LPICNFIAVRTAIFDRKPSTTEEVWQSNHSIMTDRFFEITSKRRKGFPSEARVKKGVQIVHGHKQLNEKLGRNDLCPCGSGRRFQKLLPSYRSVRRCFAGSFFPRIMQSEPKE